MRILSLDEVPDEWKNRLHSTGIDRYELFAQEVQLQVPQLQNTSLAEVIKILNGLQKNEFPYKGLKIKQVKGNMSLSEKGPMRVIVEDDSKTFFLEGLLDNDSIQYGDLSTLDTTL